MSSSFHPQAVVKGRDFLNRKNDLRALTQRLDQRVNVLLLAPRRLGKTSLIQETFRRIRSRAVPLYVDLFTATDEREMAQRILGAAYQATASKTRRAADWIKEHISGLEVAITDATTGTRIEILGRTRKGEDIMGALTSLEKTAIKQRRPVYLALDEFQRVLEWRGSEDMLGRMRSIIQEQTDVRYVFSGSKKHVLLGLVDDASAPFWGQLDLVEIRGIPVQEFAAYARRRFEAAGMRLSDEAVDRVGHWCRDNPKRIQEVFQALLMSGTQPNPAKVDETVQDLVATSAHMIRSLLDPVRSPYQLRMLRTLASVDHEEDVAIYSRGFLAEARLGTPNTAQAALKSLIDQGILDSDHRFTDPFLKLHLAASG